MRATSAWCKEKPFYRINYNTHHCWIVKLQSRGKTQYHVVKMKTINAHYIFLSFLLMSKIFMVDDFLRKIYYDYFFICCLINQNLIKLWYCLATWCQLYLRRLTTLWNSCSNQQKTIGYDRKHDAKEVCKSSWRKVLVSNVRGNGIIQNLI